MFPWIDFLLVTTAIVIVIVCYIVLLSKLNPSADELPDNLFSEFLQENDENLLVQRRMEMLEKIKEERIKEYLNRKKRKLEGS